MGFVHQEKGIDKYFFLWAMVLPITSVLVIPSIQGTTLAFMLAFMSLALVPFIAKYKVRVNKFYYTFIGILLVFVFINLSSQLSLSFSGFDNFSNVILIDPFNNQTLFKSSMFTQSLYMVAAFATFAFVRVFYNKRWNKGILIGATILAVYGIYEVVFFFATGTSGDFLTNRTFGDGDVLGSAFQKMQIGSLTLLRLKSLTGEPSMYAFTITPFFFYALYLRKNLIAIILGISLALSTSTTFFIGLAIGLFFGCRQLIKLMLKNKLTVSISAFGFAGLFLALANFGFGKIYDIVDQLIISKIAMRGISGGVRSSNFINHMNFFGDLPFLNKIFGVGFGYVRSTDFFSTLMVNTGILGTVLFTWLFLYPILKLGKESQSKVLKLILVVIFVSMMIAVPEYSYLSTWLFLGIAYNQIYKNNLEAKERRKTTLNAA